MSRVLTALLSVLVILALVYNAVAPHVVNRVDYLCDPEGTLRRFADRRLTLSTALPEDDPGDPRGDLLPCDDPETLEMLIDAHRGLLARRDSTALLADLAVLLAEAGRLDEAKALPLLSDGGLWLNRALLSLYSSGESHVANAEMNALVDSISIPWARQHVLLRLAGAKLHAADARAARAELTATVASTRARLAKEFAIIGALLLLGIVALVWGLIRRRVFVPLSEAPVEAPCSVGHLWAAGLRCFIAAGLIVAPITLFSVFVLHLDLWSGPLQLVLLFWLLNRYIYRPCGTTAGHVLGLRLDSHQFGRALVQGLAVFTLSLGGEMLLMTALPRLGLTMHWTEQAESLSELAPGRGMQLTLWTIICLWTPPYEEVLFRGLVQGGASRLLRPALSIIITTALFASIHPYSLVGILGVAWCGLVWAIARQRTRSLWPGMIGHMMINTVAVMSP